MIHNIYNITKKDLKYFINTFSIYIVFAVFLFICEWFFLSYIFATNIGDMNNLLSIIQIVLLFIIPAITIYTFVDEKKSGTIDFLITTPIRYIELILGKFFIVLYVYFVLLLILWVLNGYVLYVYSDPDLGMLFGSFLSIFLYGMVLIAIGIFVSFISNTYIVGYSISFFLSFIYFLIGKILIFLPNNISNIIEAFTYDRYFDIISKGVLDSRYIIYFILCTVFFLFFTYCAFIYKYTDFNTIRLILYTLSVLISVVLFLFIYQLSSMYYIRFDITSNKIYSLSNSTKEILKQLDTNIYIDAYYTPDIPTDISTKKYLKDLLDEYSFITNKFVYKFIDPINIQQQIINDGILPINISSKSTTSVNIQQVYMGIAIRYKGKKEIIPVLIDTENIEFLLTSAIYKLIHGQSKNILIVQDDKIIDINKEMNIFKDSLQKIYNINTSKIEQLNDATVNNVDLIILIDSPNKYTNTSIDVIKKAIQKNKKVLIFNNPNYVDVINYNSEPTIDNFKDLLNEYGIYRDLSLAVDLDSLMIPVIQKYGNIPVVNYILYPFFPVVQDLNKNINITKKLDRIIYAYGSVLKKSDTNHNVVSIGKTSKNSFKFIDMSNIIPLQNWEEISKNSIEKGPFDIGYFINSGAIAVFGSVYLASDIIVKLSDSKESLHLVLNTIDEMISDFTISDIRSKKVKNRIEKIPENTQLTLKIFFIIGFPIIILIFGFVKNLLRKYYTR